MTVSRVAGECRVTFAFSIGLAVELDAAQGMIREGADRPTLRRTRRAPAWINFDPPPIRVAQDGEPVSVGDRQTARLVECTIYDFGSISIAYRLSIDDPIDALPALSLALHDHPELLDDARQRAALLLDAVRPAVRKPSLSAEVEDYVVFALRSPHPELTAASLLRDHAPTIARILQAEADPLSDQQTSETVSSRIAYGLTDLAVLDWNAALLFDPEPGDAMTVLEHANVELLEMRLLDAQLDRLLDDSHQLLTRRRGRRWLPVPPDTRDLRRLAELHLESALAFEGVNNAIKLVGDQYLARLYRIAAAKLHIPDWDSTVLRKLAAADSVYDKITDFETTARLETLEIIIILLIAISIILPFLPVYPAH